MSGEINEKQLSQSQGIEPVINSGEAIPEATEPVAPSALVDFQPTAPVVEQGQVPTSATIGNDPSKSVPKAEMTPGDEWSAAIAAKKQGEEIPVF